MCPSASSAESRENSCSFMHYIISAQSENSSRSQVGELSGSASFLGKRMQQLREAEFPFTPKPGDP